MYQEVIKFWFEELEPSQWWAKDDAFDALIISRFANIHKKAANCELYAWRETAEGRLAEIIILDQFSRNMFRDSSFAFANDSLALALSQEAIASGADKELTQAQCSILYLPFMHSESLVIHEVAMELYAKNSIQMSLDFEIRHKEIIEQFGRYPHRNKALGRDSTKQEIEFLKQGGSSF